MIGPDRRTPCERFAADLAGYADQSLSRARTDAVRDHLADCQSCQDEVISLKSLCATLSAVPKASGAPAGLESRLVSIAGEESSSPLYLSGTTEGALPSVRARRRRLVAVTVASGTVAVLFVLTLALMVAPDLKVVDDPTRPVRQDFTAAIAAVGMNETVAAVLIARDRGAQLERVASVDPLPVEGAARRVPLAQALEWLAGVQRPQTAFTGVQRVAIADGSGFVVARVEVAETPQVGTSMTVQSSSGETFLTSFLASQDIWDAALFDADYEYYGYTRAAVIAGHTVGVLEARSGGTVVARWWLNPDDKVLLWSERYDRAGGVTMASGYESISSTAATTTTNATRVASLPYGGVPVGDWCQGWTTCPETLAGLPLVAWSSTGVVRPTMHLVYSNGVTMLTVVRQWGVLADPNSRIEEVGVPRVRCWQSGTSVVSLATNGSEALLDVAQKALPYETPVVPDLAWQVRAGLARLSGASDG